MYNLTLPSTVTSTNLSTPLKTSSCILFTPITDQHQLICTLRPVALYGPVFLRSPLFPPRSLPSS